MSLELPRRVGEPAAKHTPYTHRYVPASIGLLKRVRPIVKLLEGSVGDPSEIRDCLDSGILPRKGGIVELGRSSLLGSIDFQALELTNLELILSPQLKSNVDQNTKLPKQAGFLTLTTFDIRPEFLGECRGVLPLAEIFNPDEENWKAARYSKNQRLRQNEFGMAVGEFSLLDVAHLRNFPVTSDTEAGLTIVKLIR